MTATLSSIITSITTVFGGVIDMVGDVTAAIADDPLLLLVVVAIPLCGIGVGMFRRLFKFRA